MRYVVLFVFLFISVAISNEKIADVCNGMGCVSSNFANCDLYFDGELQKIVLKKENRLCKDKFIIQKKNLLISFCRSSIDSICARNKMNDKLFVCQNRETHILESAFYEKSDSVSQNLLFELALKGKFSVIKDDKSVDNAYYAKKYSLYCQVGGQRGEMIFLDNENWLLSRKNYWLWF